MTFRRVVVSLRGPGQSPVLPFACCVGSLRSVPLWCLNRLKTPWTWREYVHRACTMRGRCPAPVVRGPSRPRLSASGGRTLREPDAAALQEPNDPVPSRPGVCLAPSRAPLLKAGGLRGGGGVRRSFLWKHCSTPGLWGAGQRQRYRASVTPHSTARATLQSPGLRDALEGKGPQGAPGAVRQAVGGGCPSG